jgi:hypothetical protein
MSFRQIEPASARHGSDLISILLLTLPFRAAVKKGSFHYRFIVTVGADHLKGHFFRQHGHLWWIGSACCEIVFRRAGGVSAMAGRIFISYSQKQLQPTRDFAVFLRSEGYSVWTDADLIPGDRREVIERELNAADAVIVIWTNDSVESD